MIVFLLLALPFVMAAIVAALRHLPRAGSAWLAATAPLLGLTLLLTQGRVVASGQLLRAGIDWVPQIGLRFSLRLDGLGWMLACLIVVIGALVVLYAHYYLNRNDHARRFHAYLLLFMGAMLGLVLAGNLLLLVLFWELTSLSSFLLIGFWSQRRAARDGARIALTITGAGGLALLGGVLLLGRIVGSYELDDVLAAGAQIRASALYPYALALILIAAFSKSAQFPFHFWLPQAMTAPTPVSAYLHSATMVKAGVFLLARLHPALAGGDLFFYTVTTTGAVTLLIGAWHAIFQHDLKGLLAYSTISHLGLMTMLLGLSTPLAVVAALFHLLNHALFKASLFMAAGIIDHETGSRDLRHLGNLRRLMPVTSALAIVASLAMAGIPLLNGFLSKEMFFAVALETPAPMAMRVFTAIAALLAGLLGVAYSLRFVHDAFFGNGPRALSRTPHEPPRWMRAPQALLVAACVVVGVAPAVTIAPLLRAGATAVLGPAVPDYQLSIWHGWNAPLAMSALGVIGGLLLYVLLRRRLDLHRLQPRSTGRSLFDCQMETLLALATRVSAALNGGGLRRRLAALVLSALLVATLPLLHGAGLPLDGASQPMPALGWALWLLLVAPALATLSLYRHRLLAVLALGGSGLAVSLVFVFLSAPDLALTQLLVEMVTLVLMLLALNYLPASSPAQRTRWRRGGDALLALAAGSGVALLAYAVMTRPANSIADELLARALPEGHGRNVVNVILVDIRGFDTFGEICVFAIAALVVHALLRRARMAPERHVSAAPIRLPVPADLAQLMFPLTLTVSLYLFLRGHNAPGGGFIAALVLAVPLLMQYVIQGAASVESRFGFDYLRLIGAGLLLALGSGAAAMLFGVPFLSSGNATLSLPLLGRLELASTLGFDSGVYLLVFAAAMRMLATLGTLPPSRTRHSQRGVLDPAQRSSRTGELR